MLRLERNTVIYLIYNSCLEIVGTADIQGQRVFKFQGSVKERFYSLSRPRDDAKGKRAKRINYQLSS